MQKHGRNLSFVLLCLFMLPIAQAQNDVPIHPVDGNVAGGGKLMLISDLRMRISDSYLYDPELLICCYSPCFDVKLE